jgi:hypothetical protein
MISKLLILFLVCAPAFGQKLVTPEEFLNGAENLRLLAKADIVSVEKVLVPPKTKITPLPNGHFKFEEQGVIIWDGGSLTVVSGPIAVPLSLASRIKSALAEPWFDDGMRMGCGYIPVYRIALNEPEHVLQILVIDCYDSLQVYRDGVRLGGRLPGKNGREFREIISELNTLLNEANKEPNKAPVPTATSVTPAADAPVAPAAAAAQL